MQIELSPTEFYIAASVGIMRQIKNLRNGLAHKHGALPEDGWRLHIEGACGEAAFAKALGIYWNGAIGNFDAKDAGNWQVRTAAHHGHKLIVHPDDQDQDRFVLLTGLAPRFHIRGWMLGSEAKQQEFWSDPSGKNRHAFFVPIDRLNVF